MFAALQAPTTHFAAWKRKELSWRQAGICRIAERCPRSTPALRSPHAPSRAGSIGGAKSPNTPDRRAQPLCSHGDRPVHSIGPGAARIAAVSSHRSLRHPLATLHHTAACPRPCSQCFKQQRSSKRRVGCRVQCAAMPQSLREAAGAALLSAAAAATLLLPAAPAVAVSGGGGEC